MLFVRLAVALACLALLGCRSDGGGSDDAVDSSSADTSTDDPDPVVDWPTLACDPLVPEFCGHPFPSNVFTAADPSTPTGRRLALSNELMPVSYYGVQGDPTPWSRSDGFSPGSGIMVFLPDASAARSTLNAQRSTLNAQRSTLNAQRSTLNAQRSTRSARRAPPARGRC